MNERSSGGGKAGVVKDANASLHAPKQMLLSALVLGGCLVFSAHLLAVQAKEDRLQRQCFEYLHSGGNDTEAGIVMAALKQDDGRFQLAGEYARNAAAFFGITDEHSRYCVVPVEPAPYPEEPARSSSR